MEMNQLYGLQVLPHVSLREISCMLCKFYLGEVFFFFFKFSESEWGLRY